MDRLYTVRCQKCRCLQVAPTLLDVVVTVATAGWYPAGRGWFCPACLKAGLRELRQALERMNDRPKD